MERYNLVVIGAGSAGLLVAAGAAGLGARVALVERDKMGGDCLNYGCVPSKALLRSARAAAEPRRRRYGVGAAQPVPRWTEVAARVQSVIDTIAPNDSVERFESLGVDVLLGRARLTSPHTVEVALHDGPTRSLEGKRIVLATGSGPLVPPIPGLEDAGYLTNETVFSHREQPGRLLVLGGGPIGVELGQAFARLGSQVTVVEMLPRLLPREDADAAEVVFGRSVVNGWGFDVEALALARRLGYSCVEIPVTWEHVDGGTLTPTAYVTTLGDVVRVRWRLLFGSYDLSSAATESVT
ncbi:MAG: FAD-dependent oxidoreductase [SAR324 cluster bacterium]|nr:FAD-dependent oxidoreductase [SAR324 cluster bacterium]